MIVHNINVQNQHKKTIMATEETQIFLTLDKGSVVKPFLFMQNTCVRWPTLDAHQPRP